jgi:hypothetical protein
MLHPITMLLLFATSLYSGSLGLKWRQLRSLGEELRDLNSQLPVISTGKVASPIATSIDKIKQELTVLAGSEDNETPIRVNILQRDLQSLESSIGLDNKIIELGALRKNLQGQNLKVFLRHFTLISNFNSFHLG